MPVTKKWDDKAERDLMFSMILANNDGSEQVIKPKWDEVTKTMTDWGHTFTKEAIK